jgi:hypothetical protein
MTTNEFINQYRILDKRRDELQNEINELKKTYLDRYELQPGDLVKLAWENGDSETVAVVSLKLDNQLGAVRPRFLRVNADGTPSQTIIGVQRGYTALVEKRGAFPQFMIPNEDYPVSDELSNY